MPMIRIPRITEAARAMTMITQVSNAKELVDDEVVDEVVDPEQTPLVSTTQLESAFL